MCCGMAWHGCTVCVCLLSCMLDYAGLWGREKRDERSEKRGDGSEDVVCTLYGLPGYRDGRLHVWRLKNLVAIAWSSGHGVTACVLVCIW